MGYLQDWIFSLRNQYSIIFFLFFLILSSTRSRFVPPGRTISKLNEENAQIGVRRENLVMERRVIGSRPPRCDTKCRACGHCEAVQVPIAPPWLLKVKTTQQSVYVTPKIMPAYSRGDDISNYKPMCWMCKCGDFIFYP